MTVIEKGNGGMNGKGYFVTGNTFSAKSVLNDAGFEWFSADKVWFGNESAKDELIRITAVSYSKSNANACANITVEQIQ